MILHASFTVGDPHAVAETLARLMGGEAFPLADAGGRAWMAMAGDDRGTVVQLLPRGIEFHHVQGRHVAHRQGVETLHSGCHILIETPLDETAVLAIAEARGWPAHRADHGPIAVIELWVEGCLLIEVATPELAAAYRTVATLANVRSMMA